jgi:hypothetical protein
MATTTNYSWATPDDTDLVKDGAAAIRTLGSSADTTVKALSPGTTAGDLDYYTSGTAKARLGIGTAGQILQVNSGATAPEWAAPASGGKVLQAVYASTSTPATTGSTTYVDTNLTASITPTSATSKILVLVSQNGVQKPNTSNNSGVGLRLLRGASSIATIGVYFGFTGTSIFNLQSVSASYLDEPATTSATTYKTQFNSSDNNAGAAVQDNNCLSTITLLEIGA